MKQMVNSVFCMPRPARLLSVASNDKMIMNIDFGCEKLSFFEERLREMTMDSRTDGTRIEIRNRGFRNEKQF
jgi:hypothetical protein